MQTAIITGANSGIGKETARALAQQGYRVILACRSQTKGQLALAELQASYPTASLHLELVDLTSLKEIRDFASRIKRGYDRLDVLVNNAGLFLNTFTETAEGIEQTFAVNHLGYFRLTLALQDLLKANQSARVVNVSSGAHFGVRKPPTDWQMRQKYVGFAAYSQSKFANVLFTYHLAQLWLHDGVTVNCLHPGVVATQFGLNNPQWYMQLAMNIASRFALSAADGAATQIYLATSLEVAHVTGKYFDKRQVRQSAALSYDTQLQQQLWDYSLSLGMP